MSRLGDLENTIVTLLADALIGGAPAFETVRGVSGGFRPALRDALRRERMPAAYVAFTEDPTAPEVRDEVRGARFSVLVAARTLRLESNPRHGDDDATGAFELLDVVRAQLDGYEPETGFQLLNLREKFIEADDRVAIYESLYRVWPVVEGLPAQTLLWRPPKVGEYTTGLFNGAPSVGQNYGADFLYAVPIILPARNDYSGLSVRVPAAEAGKSVRLGIYEDDDGNPGDLLEDAGQTSVATTGMKDVSFAAVRPIGPGFYWLAVLTDGNAVKFEGTAPESAYTIAFVASGFKTLRYVWKDQTYGALPNPFGAPNRNDDSLDPPHLLLKGA